MRTGHDIPNQKIGVDEARGRVLGAFRPLPMASSSLTDALGLVLAADVVADGNAPAFANAAMDGFAVRWSDTESAEQDRPVRLRVVAEVAAGAMTSSVVKPGTAVRIMTGAPFPAGGDAVVPFEHTDERFGAVRRGVGDTVTIYRGVSAGDNVRRVGEDVRSGETVLFAGTRVRPAEIGVLAMLNHSNVLVHRRPRVGILTTGDEVVASGEALAPGQIRDSNGPMIAAMVTRLGGQAVVLGAARDRVDELRDRLTRAAGLDLLITTGGVSVGDYDLVKQVLDDEGRIAFWEVRMRPGKPLAFGWLGTTPLLGLPGNPVAAAVSFEQFARPAIRKMLGRHDLAIPTVSARITQRIENGGNHRRFVRVVVTSDADGHVASVAGGQGSGMLSTLAKANGLLVIPETRTSAEVGEVLPVQMLDWDLG